MSIIDATMFHMSDSRNAFLAWASSLVPVFAAVETRDLITIVSAIVLPVIFFTVGKTVDVLLQVYLRRRSGKEEDKRRD